ncbi:MAG: hypothetical protein IKE77_00665 [Erysipelotrichaceae bacterium]|nr:hypothetical protein [Erysipelotrichaceae bacterium]
MSHTNATQHYQLPQFIGTDTPGWLTDVNQGFAATDAAIYQRQQDIAANAGDISVLESDVTVLQGKMNTAESAITEQSQDITALEATTSQQTQDIGALNSAVAGIGASIAADVWSTCSITLTSAGWVSDRQSYSDASLVTNKMKFVAIDPTWLATASDADVKAITAAMIMPIAENAGSVTFRAFNGAPAIDAHLICYIADSHF